MSKPGMSLNEVRTKGYAALMKALGPVGYIRFLQQFGPGKGDYTKDRRKWLDKLDSTQIRELILEHQKAKGPRQKRG